MSAFEERIVEDPVPDPMANVLDHPLGAWPVTEVTIQLCQDPENTVFSAERVLDILEDSAKKSFDDHSVVLRIKDEDTVGYVLAPYPHPGGHGYPDYGPCDCGPELPEDWHEQIRPLIPTGLLTLMDVVREFIVHGPDDLRGGPAMSELLKALDNAERSIAP